MSGCREGGGGQEVTSLLRRAGHGWEIDIGNIQVCRECTRAAAEGRAEKGGGRGLTPRGAALLFFYCRGSEVDRGPGTC